GIGPRHRQPLGGPQQRAAADGAHIAVALAVQRLGGEHGAAAALADQQQRRLAVVEMVGAVALEFGTGDAAGAFGHAELALVVLAHVDQDRLAEGDPALRFAGGDLRDRHVSIIRHAAPPADYGPPEVALPYGIRAGAAGTGASTPAAARSAGVLRLPKRSPAKRTGAMSSRDWSAWTERSPAGSPAGNAARSASTRHRATSGCRPSSSTAQAPSPPAARRLRSRQSLTDTRSTGSVSSQGVRQAPASAARPPTGPSPGVASATQAKPSPANGAGSPLLETSTAATSPRTRSARRCTCGRPSRRSQALSTPPRRVPRPPASRPSV